MSELETYEIRKVYTVNGTFWTVVAFDIDGQVLGGDDHWMTRDGAERAMAGYNDGTAKHGEWFS